MKIKNLLNKYITFYKLNEKSSNPKELFTKAILDKNYDFYILELSQDNRTWQSSICFSLGEVTALKSEYTHKKERKKRTKLDLQSKREGSIKNYH